MSSVRLADAPPLSAAEIASVALSLATAVAELHGRGVVHGHIRPSRVTLDESQVRLDPPDGDGFSKPHDVRSIGELTLWLLSRSALRQSGALVDAAREAANLDPAARPTAEELRARLQQVVEAGESELEPPDPARRRHSFALLGGTGAIAAVLAGALLAIAPGRLSTDIPAPRSPVVGAPHDTARDVEPRLPPGKQVWPDAMRACEDPAGSLAGDLDGDGCEEGLETQGERLEATSGAVAVKGVSIDGAVTGDWHCRRESTLAALDAVSGAVFVFPRWARPGDDVEATHIGSVRGAIALLTGDVDGDGCDDLRVATGGGDEVRIPVPQP